MGLRGNLKALVVELVEKFGGDEMNFAKGGLFRILGPAREMLDHRCGMGVAIDATTGCEGDGVREDLGEAVPAVEADGEDWCFCGSVFLGHGPQR